MALTAPLSGFSDQLTRTTLLLDPSTSLATLLQVKRKLQDVPGVLLADVRSMPNTATIAHDGAVPITAFVEAARSVGVSVIVEPQERAVAEPVVVRDRRLRSIVTVGVVAFLSFAFANVINRLNPTNHWVNFTVLFSMCILVTILGVSSRRAR